MVTGSRSGMNTLPEEGTSCDAVLSAASSLIVALLRSRETFKERKNSLDAQVGGRRKTLGPTSSSVSLHQDRDPGTEDDNTVEHATQEM